MLNDLLTSRRCRRGIGLTVAVVLCVWVWAEVVEREERTIDIEIACSGEVCSVRAGSAELETTVAPTSARAGMFGLYVYHPHEFDRPQYFRRLEMVSTSVPDRPLSLPLDRPGWQRHWLADEGWRFRPGRGLTHVGELGTRSAAMLASFRAQDFRARIELDSSVDAGLLFRASNSTTGTVLVVRSQYNDVFFFDILDGEVGQIRNLTELRPLRTGREALRLGGRLAGLLLIGLAAVLLLRGLALLGRRVSLPDWPFLVIPDRAPRGVVVGLALAAVLLLASVAWFGLGGIPHVPDENAYLFQAMIFAEGELWAPSPGLAHFFGHEHVVITEDRWFSKYPPMFSMLLVPGVLAGRPWLVSPVLGALTLLGIFFLARALAGWRWAVVAAVLTLTSPFFLVLGGTMMSHMACAAFLVWMLFFVIRGLQRQEPRWGIAAGLCLGLAIWTRPFTALLVAAAAGIYGLTLLRRSPARRRVLALGLLGAVVALPFAAGFLAWNGLHTDRPGLALGLYDTFYHSDTLGFGPDKGAGWLHTWGSWGHTPAKGLRSVDQYLEYTSRHLLGWPLQLSFVFVCGAFLARRRSGFEGLLLLVFLSLMAGHMFYWASHNILYGARYWFSALPGLMVLSALGLRGIVNVEGRSERVFSFGSCCVAAVVALLIGWNLTAYLPVRLAELEHYCGVSAALKREVDQRQLTRAIIFIDYQIILDNEGFFMNDPFQRDERLFVRDLDERNREILDRFPDRPAFRWTRGRLLPLGPSEVAALPASSPGTVSPAERR